MEPTPISRIGEWLSTRRAAAESEGAAPWTRWQTFVVVALAMHVPVLALAN